MRFENLHKYTSSDEMVRIFLVLRFMAVFLLKTKCVFGNTCDCELVRDALTKEIFDLKIENRQLTSRMDQIESLLHFKTSEMNPSIEFDTDQGQLMETRISAIESKIQETTSYSKKSLQLHDLIAKGLRAENSERLRNELKIEAGLKKINDSLMEFNLQSNASFQSFELKTSDHIREIKSDISHVRNDVAGISNKVAGLENQTNDLSMKCIEFAEETMDAIKQDISRMETDVNAIIDMLILDQKAICQPNCTNDGVCFKDNVCKCKPLTEGTRCEIAICDDQCSENGGECVAPGICKCPEGRFGPNCNEKRCKLPTHAAIPRNPKLSYRPGEHLASLYCDDGFALSSQDEMTCLQDGSWSNIVTCEKAIVYHIRIKTDDSYGPGTDATMYISLHGLTGKTDKINLQGTFETGSLDETNATAKDIRPVTSVEIGLDKFGLVSIWKLEYVFVYVESMEEYYLFRLEESVLIKAGEKTVLPVKGNDSNCVDSFDRGHTWLPKWRVLGTGRYHPFGRTWSARICKQQCIELTIFPCVAVYYNKNDYIDCYGISVSGESFFSMKENRKRRHLVYLRTCKEVK